MNVEETITTVTRRVSVQTHSAPTRATVQWDTAVMVICVQVITCNRTKVIDMKCCTFELISIETQPRSVTWHH